MADATLTNTNKQAAVGSAASVGPRIPSIDKAVAALEAVVGNLIGLHDELGRLMDEKRTALREADTNLMSQSTELENQKIQRISELEKKRLELIAALTLQVKPEASEPMRMRELAEAMDEPMRGKLLVLRQQLLDAIKRVADRSRVTRKAAQSLLGHMQGLMQAVATAASGGATYGQQGTMPNTKPPMTTISVTA